jgi:hypothetical protein
MKLKLAALAASTGLATSAFFGVLPADAQALGLTVTPTSGTDGVFNVSGSGCLGELGPGVVDLFIDGQPLVNDDVADPDVADEEGNWSIDVSPEDPTIPLEPGVLTITATCTVNDGSGTPIVEYSPATYEIVAAQDPAPAPEPEPVPEAPAPATPVVAEPTFTG